MTSSNIRLSTNDKISIISDLSTMLISGISILEAIDSLLEDAKGKEKKVLEVFLANLQQGLPLYVSMQHFPNTFDPVTVSLVKASEEAGTLDTVLADLAENIQKEAEFADTIKSALAYPIFVMIIFVAVFLLMLVFVVPRISTVFSRLNVDLPLATRVIIYMSDFLMNYTIFVIGFFAIVIGALVILYRTRREILLSILFSIPHISGLIRQIDLARLSRNLYLLLNSGLTITSALELTEGVVLKGEVKNAIIESKEEIISGHRLSAAFKKHKDIFPPLMIRMIETGEKTGTLEKSLQHTHKYMTYHVSKKLKQFTTLFEPVMLVVVGGVIGGMMLAIIAPIYNIIGQVASR